MNAGAGTGIMIKDTGTGIVMKDLKRRMPAQES